MRPPITVAARGESCASAGVAKVGGVQPSAIRPKRSACVKQHANRHSSAQWRTISWSTAYRFSGGNCRLPTFAHVFSPAWAMRHEFVGRSWTGLA